MQLNYERYYYVTKQTSARPSTVKSEIGRITENGKFVVPRTTYGLMSERQFLKDIKVFRSEAEALSSIQLDLLKEKKILEGKLEKIINLLSKTRTNIYLNELPKEK